MSRSSIKLEVNRDELIFKVLSTPNSIFLTWREVGSATQRLVTGMFWVFFTMSSNGKVLGGGF